MNNALKKSLVFLVLFIVVQSKAYSYGAGQISGTLLLDESWDRTIYLSFIENLEKEYSISNNLILESAPLDSLGNFKIYLDEIPEEWSLLRLHVVKKGGSPNSLVIGSTDENFYFLIAKRSSEINVYNGQRRPIFANIKVEGADYMKTFEYIRKLMIYPNSIDYENSLIEKEFIVDAVAEKLKVVADTCGNPLVSLYALYQTNYQYDYHQNPEFYDQYSSKWKSEKGSYFETFRSKNLAPVNISANSNTFLNSMMLFIVLVAFAFVSIFFYKRKNNNIKKLSVQERKIFDLIRKGLSNKEISADCNIEVSTVKSHVSSIYSKLKIKSRREAVNLKVK